MLDMFVKTALLPAGQIARTQAPETKGLASTRKVLNYGWQYRSLGGSSLEPARSPTDLRPDLADAKSSRDRQEGQFRSRQPVELLHRVRTHRPCQRPQRLARFDIERPA